MAVAMGLLAMAALVRVGVRRSSPHRRSTSDGCAASIRTSASRAPVGCPDGTDRRAVLVRPRRVPPPRLPADAATSMRSTSRRSPGHHHAGHHDARDHRAADDDPGDHRPGPHHRRTVPVTTVTDTTVAGHRPRQPPCRLPSIPLTVEVTNYPAIVTGTFRPGDIDDLIGGDVDRDAFGDARSTACRSSTSAPRSTSPTTASATLTLDVPTDVDNSVEERLKFDRTGPLPHPDRTARRRPGAGDARRHARHHRPAAPRPGRTGDDLTADQPDRRDRASPRPTPDTTAADEQAKRRRVRRWPSTWPPPSPAPSR